MNYRKLPFCLSYNTSLLQAVQFLCIFLVFPHQIFASDLQKEGFIGNISRIIEDDCDYEKTKKGLVLSDCVKEVTTYNPNGNIKDYKRYISGILEDHMIYKYDSLNSLIEVLDYDNKGNIQNIRKFSYKYNESGKVMESKEIDLNGKITRIINELRYDSLGNLVRRIIVNEDGDQDQRSVSYEYYKN